MKIAIVGDLQYWEGESIDEIVTDINSLEVDGVILLGDYGYWDGFGSYDVFSQVADAFSKLSCKVFMPLIGNHDVQYEAGGWRYERGTVTENYTRAFGRKPENCVLEFDSFRIFCIHMDVQEKDEFYHAYECYVTDEHFDWVKEELEKEPDKPVIMVTHAPPADCGLLTLPEVHIRAANAYLDQNHNMQRWCNLSHDCRQIILWFSGHYHMGHHHKNSMSVRDGIGFFTTGSASSGCRDGQRHTRIVQVENGCISVFTYDHTGKKTFDEPDYVCEAKIRGEAKEICPYKVFAAGCGKVVEGGLKLGKNDKIYAMTDNNYLWEIDIEKGITTGTLHFSDKYILDDFAVDESYIWRFCGKDAFGHCYSDANRFMREKDWERCRYIKKTKAEWSRDRECLKHEEKAFFYKGRVACGINADMICSAYNDEEGTLFFEISRAQECNDEEL